ncbi:jg2950, partial [Pararge aegeria aegeria]
MFQNGTEASQSTPTADSSPGNSISDAENFECYGEADGDAPSSNTLVLMFLTVTGLKFFFILRISHVIRGRDHIIIMSINSLLALKSHGLENGSRSPGNHLNRHSWTRTSLRRTPP